MKIQKKQNQDIKTNVLASTQDKKSDTFASKGYIKKVQPKSASERNVQIVVDNDHVEAMKSYLVEHYQAVIVEEQDTINSSTKFRILKSPSSVHSEGSSGESILSSSDISYEGSNLGGVRSSISITPSESASNSKLKEENDENDKLELLKKIAYIEEEIFSIKTHVDEEKESVDEEKKSVDEEKKRIEEDFQKEKKMIEEELQKEKKRIEEEIQKEKKRIEEEFQKQKKRIEEEFQKENKKIEEEFQKQKKRIEEEKMKKEKNNEKNKKSVEQKEYFLSTQEENMTEILKTLQRRKENCRSKLHNLTQ